MMGYEYPELGAKPTFSWERPEIKTRKNESGNTVVSSGGKERIVPRPLAGTGLAGGKDHLSGPPKGRKTEESGTTFAADKIQELARNHPWEKRAFTKDDIPWLNQIEYIPGTRTRSPFFIHPHMVESARDSQNLAHLQQDQNIKDRIRQSGLMHRIKERDPDTGEIIIKEEPAKIHYGDTLAGLNMQIKRKLQEDPLVHMSRNEADIAVNNAKETLGAINDQRFRDEQAIHRDEMSQWRSDRNYLIAESNKLQSEMERYKVDKDKHNETIKLALVAQENERRKHEELIALDREKWEEGRKDRKSDRNFGAVGQGIEALMLLFGGL